jgi:response regulator RpfG family c-di-GMP phosphodiesterase
MIDKKKILVVDDEITNVIMLAAMLRLDDFVVETYTDPKQALTVLQETPENYSIILADRMMPHLTAVQLLHKLRESEQTSAIPFVLITGLAEQEEKIELIKAGVFDILIKPIDRAILMGVVKRAYRQIGLMNLE